MMKGAVCVWEEGEGKRLAVGMIDRLPREWLGPRVLPSRPNATTQTLWVAFSFSNAISVVGDDSKGRKSCLRFSAKGERKERWARPGSLTPVRLDRAWSPF